MTLNAIAIEELQQRAATTGIRYQTGPFSVCLHSNIAGFLATLQQIYAQAPVLDEDAVCHFHIRVERPGGVRRWFRPQALFSIDGETPFEPYPLSQAFPLYEWGLNWCIAISAHHNLMLHSAVVERGGQCLILPALPGSGKSTLCAGLVNRGWRLLSDEFGIVRHADGQVLPLPRAAPLKNRSIAVLRNYAPDAVFGPLYERTRKGDVVHLAPSADCLRRQQETATPRWVVFPRYQPGAPVTLTPQTKSLAFTRLVNNAFNYKVTMAQGFDTLTRLIHQVDSYDLVSGDLNEAVQAMEHLATAEAA